MAAANPAYEKTYKDYIAQVGDVDFGSVADKLGAEVSGRDLIIPVFGKPYAVSVKGVKGPSGKAPTLDVSVILCKYVLMCPETIPEQDGWASFRDLKDTGPLTVYYANDVERAIADRFSGKVDELEAATRRLGSMSPGMDVTYDVSARFAALPKVPLLMLFNDVEDQFPETCSVLMERRAESYLDAECLAMLGRLLATRLIRSSR